MWNRPQLLTAIADLLLAAAAAALLVAGTVWVAKRPHFILSEVVVMHELKEVRRAEVERALAGLLRGNFFSVNVEAVRQSLERISWIRHAEVRRRWPSSLELRIEEHEPAAQWGEGAGQLLNTHGEVFTAASDAHLPVFTGPIDVAPEIATQYARFQTALSPLGRQVAEIQVSDRRAWRITLDDGMTLELGRDRVAERVEKFVAAYAVSIARMREAPRIVDLRYPNGFAVRVKTADNGA